MANRTPLTARAGELMIDLQIAAEEEHSERIRSIAVEAAMVWEALDKERMDFIYETNHGIGQRARDRWTA